MGPEGFQDFLRGLLKHYKEFKATPEKVLGADDDHVIVTAGSRSHERWPGRRGHLGLGLQAERRAGDAGRDVDRHREACATRRSASTGSDSPSSSSPTRTARRWGGRCRRSPAELRDGDELIVVDNASGDGTPEPVARAGAAGAADRDRAEPRLRGGLQPRAPARPSGELLVMLNPDAVPGAGFRDAIAKPLDDGRGWAAWQGLVTAEEGRVINTSGGVVHFTGHRLGGRRASRPAGAARGRERGPVSSPAPAWRSARALSRELGGYPGDFFLYHEDVDLSLRLRLAGGRLGVEPAARVDHDYEFDKGAAKWRYLERNRWATLVRTYPAALLCCWCRRCCATELRCWCLARRAAGCRRSSGPGGRRCASLPRLLRERRAIQGQRTIGAGEFAAPLAAELVLAVPRRRRALAATRRAAAGLLAVVLALLGPRSRVADPPSRRPGSAPLAPAPGRRAARASRRATSWARTWSPPRAARSRPRSAAAARRRRRRRRGRGAFEGTAMPSAVGDRGRAGRSRPRGEQGQRRTSTAARSARPAGAGGPARARSRTAAR